MISAGQCNFRIDYSGDVSTQILWHLSVYCLGGEPNIETVAAVPSAFAMVPHKSIFPCMIFCASQAADTLTVPRVSPWEQATVHGPFKGGIWVFRFLPCHPVNQDPH